MEKYLVFYHGQKGLAAYTLRGTFPGERESTIELLARENGISPQAIHTKHEER